MATSERVDAHMVSVSYSAIEDPVQIVDRVTARATARPVSSGITTPKIVRLEMVIVVDNDLNLGLRKGKGQRS